MCLCTTMCICMYYIFAKHGCAYIYIYICTCACLFLGPHVSDSCVSACTCRMLPDPG